MLISCRSANEIQVSPRIYIETRGTIVSISTEQSPCSRVENPDVQATPTGHGGLENAGIFPVSSCGQRNGSRAPAPPGLHILMIQDRESLSAT
jgi:hypothetical protein